MKQQDWNPRLYLQFSSERSAPSVDLTAKIALESPQTVLDVGCGPGNSACVLLSRWPESRITGIDTSPAMIEQAKALHPAHRWVVDDAGKLTDDQRYDLVFSNAALQWIPSHEILIPALAQRVKEDGALAVQIPRYDAMPVSSLVDRAFQSLPGVDRGFTWESFFTFHDPLFYDNLLRSLGGHFTVWETTYFHRLATHQAILEMLSSTGLRPYFAKLESAAVQQEFEKSIVKALPESYPFQNDGAVLFPFRRLFFLWTPKS